MFIVDSYSVAVFMCVITMLCWGSWANTQKLAGKTWRIGLMGYASNERNVLSCLNALDAVLDRSGAAINSGVALDAAQAVFRATG